MTATTVDLDPISCTVVIRRAYPDLSQRGLAWLLYLNEDALVDASARISSDIVAAAGAGPWATIYSRIRRIDAAVKRHRDAEYRRVCETDNYIKGANAKERQRRWTPEECERAAREELVEGETHQQAIDRLGLKPGDAVRLVAKCRGKERGWHNAWPRTMDAAIGRVFTVAGVCPSGIYPDGLITGLQRDDHASVCGYPAHCLIKLS